jgi:hypothetical protein
MHTEFWFTNLLERDHLEEIGVDGRRMFKWILKKWSGRLWVGLICLRIGMSGGLL